MSHWTDFTPCHQRDPPSHLHSASVQNCFRQMIKKIMMLHEAFRVPWKAFSQTTFYIRSLYQISLRRRTRWRHKSLVLAPLFSAGELLSQTILSCHQIMSVGLWLVLRAKYKLPSAQPSWSTLVADLTVLTLVALSLGYLAPSIAHLLASCGYSS